MSGLLVVGAAVLVLVQAMVLFATGPEGIVPRLAALPGARGRWTPEIATGVVWAVVMAPVLSSLAQHRRTPGFDANDHIFHMLITEQFRFWPPHLPIPQLGHSLLAWLVAGLIPWISLKSASAVVMVLFAGLQGAVVVWFLRRRTVDATPAASTTLAVLGSLAFLVAELPQFAFLGGDAFDGERLATSLHQWNTPTSIVVVPFQVVLFVLLVDAIWRPERRHPRPLILGLILAAGFTMPAAIIALAAGLFPWILRSGGPTWSRLAVAARLFWIPAGVMLAVQFLWFRLAVSDEYRTSLSFAPFEVVGGLGLGDEPGIVAANLLGAFAFPVLSLLVGGRELRRRAEVRLLGWCTLAGVCAFLLFAQTGTVDENMGRIAFAPYLLLNLACLHWLLGRWREALEAGGLRRAGLVVLAVFGVASLVTGVLLHLERADLLTFTGTAG